MTQSRSACALVTAATLFSMSGIALAAPTQADFDACNRGWMSVRSAVGGGSDDSVVAEAKRGEDAAKRAYQAALDRELPPPIRAIVERQSARIREAQDRVRSLRERAA